MITLIYILAAIGAFTVTRHVSHAVYAVIVHRSAWAAHRRAQRKRQQRLGLVVRRRQWIPVVR